VQRVATVKQKGLTRNPLTGGLLASPCALALLRCLLQRGRLKIWRWLPIVGVQVPPPAPGFSPRLLSAEDASRSKV
jgi:hypothetical protein